MASNTKHSRIVNLRANCLFFALVMAVIFLPLFVLFQNHNCFYFILDKNMSDWTNHLWLTGYFGEYFLQHLSFPDVINTHQYLNIPTTLFYSGLFYRIIGLLSSIAGAEIAMKFAVLLVCIIQFISVFTLTKEITKNKWLSFSISTLCLWSIYSLTNLYNRSALTEFFAVSLITTALSLWLHSFEVDGLAAKFRLRFLFTLTIAMSFCFHPITALYGSLFMLFVLIGTAQNLIREKPLSLTIFTCFCLLCYVALALSPWLYMVWKFMTVLTGIFPAATTTSVWYIPQIDSLFVRLSPFPIDMRSIAGGTNVDFGTPYLDAQTNIPLLILSIFITFSIVKYYFQSKIRQRIGAYHHLLLFLSHILFIFFLLASINPQVFSILPRAFLNAQFAYRLVTYQNLALLVSVISGLSILFANDLYPTIKLPLSVLSLVAIIISFQGIIQKEVHAWSVMRLDGKPEFSLSRKHRNDLLDLPNSFYGLSAYFVTAGMNLSKTPIASKTLHFEVGYGKEFGNAIDKATISLPKLSYVEIPIYPFPWSKIYVDGKLIDNSDLYWDGSKIATRLNAGKHVIEVKFTTTMAWQIYQNISFVLIMLGLIGTLFYYLNIYGFKLFLYSTKSTPVVSTERSL